MSWHPKLWEDVYDRAQGDTGAGGLFLSGSPLINSFTNFYVPEGTSMPYCYTFIDNTVTEDAFTATGVEVTLDVHTYAEQEPAGGGDLLSTCSLILARLEGDWLTNSAATPTYGFDRWTPSLSSTNWNASPFTFVGHRAEHEPGVWHFVSTFEGFISRQKP